MLKHIKQESEKNLKQEIICFLIYLLLSNYYETCIDYVK